MYHISRKFSTIVFMSCLAWVGWFVDSSCLAQSPRSYFGSQMWGVTIHGRKYAGAVVASDHETCTLLRRDGSLLTIPTGAVDNVIQLASDFSSYSNAEMQKRLEQEFSSGYNVVPSDHFLVVQPIRSPNSWSGTLEKLFRQFASYFERRGIRMSEPEFPLVAVVYESREEFSQCLADYQVPHPEQLVGFYCATTNRMVTYDQAGENSTDDLSMRTFETVVHEAAHQTAFNSGIHNRLQVTPRWLSEGLATMFEAKGIYNPSQYHQPADRLVDVYYQPLMLLIGQGGHRGSLEKLIADDKWFDADPQTAYALSWGWTNFLIETRGEAYSQYLVNLRARPSFADYSRDERLADFTRAFDADLEGLEGRFQQFYEKLADKLGTGGR